MTLPTGWAESTLAEVSQINMGQSPSGEYTNDLKEGLPLIGGAADLKGGRIHPTRYTSAPTKIAVPGDIVFCIRATIGRLAVAKEPVCLGRGVAGFTALVDDAWLRWLLNANANAIDQAGVGSTFRQVDAETLRDWPINVPPAAEQHRIAAKLGALTARLARARAELDRAPALAKRLREQALSEAFEAQSVQSAPLSEVLTDIRYGTAKKCAYRAGPTPVLRIPNVRAGKIELTDLKSSDFSKGELAKLSLQLGDVLVIRSNGSLDLVGRSAVVGASAVGMLYAGYLIRLRSDRERIRPLYLQQFLSAPRTRATIERVARSTSGVNNVNAQQLQSLCIPVLGLTEQDAVVRRLNAIFARADRLEAEAARARALIDRLEAAILAKAFRGELVPQDPNDEPASVLLERIRARRAAAPQPKRGRRAAAVSQSG